MKNNLVRRYGGLDSFFDDDMFNRFSYGSDIDIYKENDSYFVVADIPGFNKDEIEVEFKGDILSIKAEHNEETEDTSDKNYFYRSRSSRQFFKQVRFSDVSGDNVEANYENGVLKIALPLADKNDAVNRIEVK